MRECAEDRTRGSGTTETIRGGSRGGGGGDLHLSESVGRSIDFYSGFKKNTRRGCNSKS